MPAVLSSNEWGVAPSPEQVEITIFGPGYGECILLHVGGGNWIIVDSCRDPQTNGPVALSYLDALKIKHECIKLIVLTHWHDDHCAGISDIYSSATAAKLSFAYALAGIDFYQLVKRFSKQSDSIVGSKVSEIARCLDISANTKRSIRSAQQGKPLLKMLPEESGHGKVCLVTALSPSDSAEQDFLVEIASQRPKFLESKRAADGSGRNDISVVLWVSIGDLNILLGADMEHHPNDKMGWGAIIGADNIPPGKASVVKVPHHGAQSGHDTRMWTERVVASPIAVLSPYARGRRPAPTPQDVSRIRSISHASLSSSRMSGKKGKRRESAVGRQLREMGVRLTPLDTSFGAVRLRTMPETADEPWSIELFGDACDLADCHEGV